MSYKPSRSNGAMLDRYILNAEKYRSLVIENINNNEFENLKTLSKNIYLSWLNSNKIRNYWSRSKGNNESIKTHCVTECIYNLLINNTNLIYKPLKTLLEEEFIKN